MAFVTLSCSELLRAYTARSEFYPLLKIGAFKNPVMNLAGAFFAGLDPGGGVTCHFLQPVFNTQPLGWAQWEIILPLMLIPSVAAEVTKAAARR